MSATICLAPAKTIHYPQGGGHFWVYLNWALALRAAGCQVTWLEGLDPSADDASDRVVTRVLERAMGSRAVGAPLG